MIVETELSNDISSSAGGASGLGSGDRKAKEPKPEVNTEPSSHPNPEVQSNSPKRRNYTASYKLKILTEAEQCSKDGELGALLRREGLYSSHLNTWKQQRERGILSGLAQKRGKKKQEITSLLKEKQKLERENKRLKAQLDKASLIIDFQKKTSQMLEMIQSKGGNTL